MEFLFGAALLGLPLAAAPLLLHLLFRRKSPTVQFSTLRFIRASIQQTAARRKLHRWLLLACRVLLLALLIWAIAQPVRRLQANWTGAAHSTIAAIVVDTSYSMQLRDADVTLLSRAHHAAQDLLRNELRAARVAVFTSRPNDNGPERLTGASERLEQWAPLAPEVNQHPLADRVAAAQALLARNSADQKWLVVISDLQSREFPRPVENSSDERVVWIDLHPKAARSAGITSISLNPPQPIPGVSSELAIEAAGHQGDSRTIAVQLSRPDGSILQQLPPMTVSFDTGGRAAARMPIKLPAEPWVIAQARFTEEDSMPWDDARSALIHLPPRHPVCVLNFGASEQAARFVTLALDPSEGQLAAWPLSVRRGEDLRNEDHVAVALLGNWPEQGVAERLFQAANSGKTVILFVEPGRDALWSSLPDSQRSAWQKLLPSDPTQLSLPAPAHLLPPAGSQTLLTDVTASSDLQSALVRRMVRFDPAPRSSETLLNVSTGESSKRGLLFRKPIGAGQVLTFATIPDARLTNLATHPIFLPLLVRLAMESPQERGSLNSEVGDPISCAGAAPDTAALTIESPSHETFQLAPDAEHRWIFRGANQPGLFTWRAGGTVVGYSNVQPPAAESDLVYRDPNSVAPRADNVIVAHSLDEVRQRMQKLAEPEPKWSGAMALVLILLCFEALLGSISGFGRR